VPNVQVFAQTPFRFSLPDLHVPFSLFFLRFFLLPLLVLQTLCQMDHGFSPANRFSLSPPFFVAMVPRPPLYWKFPLQIILQEHNCFLPRTQRKVENGLAFLGSAQPFFFPHPFFPVFSTNLMILTEALFILFKIAVSPLTDHFAANPWFPRGSLFSQPFPFYGGGN